MKCLPLDSEIGIDSFSGIKIWMKNNQRHSFNDQPSYKMTDGHLFWRKDGCLHRDYGKPAAIYVDGTKLWYINDRWTKSEYP